MTATLHDFQAKAIDIKGQGTPQSASCHDRVVGRKWSAPQLRAVAEKDQEVQQHLAHVEARIALAEHACTISVHEVRCVVLATMGQIAGTYYIVAALHLAQLALVFPELLTEEQQSLLLAPLQAAEQETERAPESELFAA
ncbi:hypothetical protein [Arthrobacter globiformis]|uniref:hypothetical protein n=1 Tax=Arthrobacter globiformis TaxID=1665 RepID=UPI00277DB7DD|nr:hypothetical protein [Arthrobacter globiformis]MDQ0867443.1 hypothetical protein [Arthrobacter globiformis]